MNARSMGQVKLGVWAICALLGVGVYVAAKVDFVRRFDPNNVAQYLAGHWPYWAILTALAAIGWLVARPRSSGASQLLPAFDAYPRLNGSQVCYSSRAVRAAEARSVRPGKWRQDFPVQYTAS